MSTISQRTVVFLVKDSQVLLGFKKTGFGKGNYLCNSWQSEPVETSEMKPIWFKSDTLPLTNMWDDAQFWLPAILNGHSLKGECVFDENLKVIRTKLEEKILG